MTFVSVPVGQQMRIFEYMASFILRINFDSRNQWKWARPKFLMLVDLLVCCQLSWPAKLRHAARLATPNRTTNKIQSRGRRPPQTPHRQPRRFNGNVFISSPSV